MGVSFVSFAYSMSRLFLGHRLENLQGIRRHKINRKKRNAMASIVHIGKTDKAKKKFYKERKKYDHSPHEVNICSVMKMLNKILQYMY